MKIDELSEAFQEMFDFITDMPSGLDGFESDFDEAFKQLKQVKSDDVQEVKHGKWIAKKIIKESYNYGVPYEIFRCSECLYMLSENGLVGRYNYCPHCGARMDGEEE